MPTGSANKHPLQIVVSALDRVSRPMRRIRASIDRVFGPARRLRGILRVNYAESGIPDFLRAFGTMGSGILRATRLAAGLVSKLALLGAGAAAAGFALVRSFARSGDELQKLSVRLGISTEKLSAWHFGAKSAGLATQTFDMAMQRAGRRVAEAAAGTGEARVALKALGVQVTDSAGRVRSMESLLPELADKLSRIESEGLRNALAMKLFDSEGVAVVQMLKDGSKGLAAYEAAARRYGVVIESKAARESESFVQVLTDVAAAMTGVRNVVAEILLPPLRSFFELLRDRIVENRERIAAFVRDFMRDLPARIAILRGKLEELWAGLAPVLERARLLAQWLSENNRWIGALALAIGGLVAIMAGPLLAALAAAASGVVALGLAILTTPVGWIMAGIAGLVASIVWLGDHWDWLGEKVDAVVGWITRRLEALWQWTTGVFERVGSALSDLFGEGGKVEAKITTAGALALDAEDLVRDRRGQPGADGHLRVSFENVPDGVRVERVGGGDLPKRLDIGHALPEVGR